MHVFLLLVEVSSVRIQPGLSSCRASVPWLPGEAISPEIAGRPGEINIHVANVACVSGDLLCWDVQRLTWGESSAAGTMAEHHGGHWSPPWLRVKPLLPPWPCECRGKAGLTQLVDG